MSSKYPGQYFYAADGGTFQIKDAPGVVKRILITQAANTAVILYDHESANSNVILRFAANAAEQCYEINQVMRAGIRLQATNINAKLTVIYE